VLENDPAAAGAVAETNTYRFGLTGIGAAGTVSVTVNDIWHDTAGNHSAALTAEFELEIPAATILLPVDGTVIGADELESLKVQVEFEPAGNNSVLTNNIAASLVSVDGHAAKQVSRVGNTNIFEFFDFDNLAAGAGIYPVTVGSGWTDGAGNAATAGVSVDITSELPFATILAPAVGAVIGEAELGAIQVVVEFTPAGNNGIDPSAISAALVTVGGATTATTPVQIDGTTPP
jgi:hypothetical protein